MHINTLFLLKNCKNRPALGRASALFASQVVYSFTGYLKISNKTEEQQSEEIPFLFSRNGKKCRNVNFPLLQNKMRSVEAQPAQLFILLFNHTVHTNNGIVPYK